MLWQKEVRTVTQMISDGSGGVIIASISEAQKLNMLKIDAQGNFSWGKDGVPVYFGEYAHSLHMIGDGSGRAITVQQNLTQRETNFEIFVQKTSSDGSLPWGKKGILLYPPLGNAEQVDIVNDGSGGAMVAWQIDADGDLNWQPGGMQVCYIKANASFWPRTATNGGSGGAIIACSYKEAETNKKGLLVQRIDSMVGLYGTTE